MRKLVFFAGLAIAILCVIAAAYYSIPHIYHLFFSLHDGSQIVLVSANTDPAAVYSTHHKYSAVLIVLAMVIAVIAFVARPRRKVMARA